MNYQSIVQLFRIQPLQHGQHGGGLGAGGNGVHHQVVAALDGGCAGNLSLVLRHPGKGAAGQVKRLGGRQAGGQQVKPVKQPMGPT